MGTTAENDNGPTLEPAAARPIAVDLYLEKYADTLAREG